MPTFASMIETTLADITTVMGRSVILTSVTRGSTINTTTLIRTNSESTQTLLANLAAERQSTARAGNGERPVIERDYEIKLSLLTIGTPIKGWKLTDGSDVFEVVSVDADCDSRNLLLRCRRTT